MLNPSSETNIKTGYDEGDGITRFKVRTVYRCTYVCMYIRIVYKRKPPYNELFYNKFLDITEK